MAIIYAPATDTGLAVDTTSSAARLSLYDSAARAVVKPSSPGATSQVYSYVGNYFLGVSLAGLTALWINHGPRTCRLRSIFMSANNVSGAAAQQSPINLARGTFTSFDVVFAGVLLINPSTALSGAVPKVSHSPASGVALYLTTAGLIVAAPPDTRPALADFEIFYSFAVPQRTGAHAETYIPFDEDGEDAAFRFQPMEGFYITAPGAGAAITNALNIVVDWDEEPSF